MDIDITKPVETVNGKKAGIYGERDGFLHGWIEFTNVAVTWWRDGTCASALATHQNIRNVPETVKVECYLNAYSDGVVVSHPTRADADRNAGDDRRARLHIVHEVPVGTLED